MLKKASMKKSPFLQRERVYRNLQKPSKTRHNSFFLKTIVISTFTYIQIREIETPLVYFNDRENNLGTLFPKKTSLLFLTSQSRKWQNR